MMAPQNFKNLLKPIPQLQQLVLLMKRLPPMPISDTWTPAITQHLPLDKAVLIDIESTAEVYIPRHLTVASVLNHHPTTDAFYPKRMDKKRPPTDKIMENFRQKKIRWSPLLESQTTVLTKKLPPLTTTSPPWTHHWRWQFAPNQNPIVYRCPPSWIRSQWQKDKHASRPMPKPPYAYPPADTMNATQWKLFWTLRIPHNVRSVWWRILHNRLPTRVHLHRIMPAKFESASCLICLAAQEDAIHLLVTCPRKQEVWLTTLDETTVDPYLIWRTLTFETVPRSKTKQKEWTTTLIHGRILEAIWSHHWQVVFTDAPWSHSYVLQRMQEAENARMAIGDEGQKEMPNSE